MTAATRVALLAYVDARLAYEIDIVAAHNAQAEGTCVLVDTRKQLSWDHGHIVGAVHLPSDTRTGQIVTLPRDQTLVVYGWGPGCNGATHAARELLAAGFDARELVGGYEYWVRNGFPVERATAAVTQVADPLAVVTQVADPLVTAEP
ncbi:MAG TPA: rhodanese-like domain-containing protein [Microbacteriaceae bacterium]